jgi:hypothetical protein
MQATRRLSIVPLLVVLSGCSSGSSPSISSTTSSSVGEAELTGEAAVEALERAYPDAHVEMAADDLVESVEFDKPAAVVGVSTSADAAMRFVELRRNLFLPRDNGATRLRPALREAADAPAGAVALQQFISAPRGPGVSAASDVPVFGGEVVFQFAESAPTQIESVISNMARVAAPQATAKIPQPEAVKIALAELQRLEPSSVPRPEGTAELMLFVPSLLGLPGDNVLAWRIDIGAFRAFVNAETGAIVHRYRNTASVEPRVFECDLSMTCHAAEPPSRAPETKTLLTMTMAAYDYFMRTHQHEGFAQNAPVRAYSRYWIPDASYDPSANELRFSAGWVHRDIVAPEYTHGILFRKKNVIYTSQPGAVQEFFADVFAVLIDGPVSPWTIGESLSIAGQRKPLRDLADPNKPAFNRNARFDRLKNSGQPAHVTELVQTTDEICRTVDAYADNGCVHFNGAILSLAVFKATEGAGGIGRTKLAHIAYAAMMDLPRAPLLSKAAQVLTNACARLARRGLHGMAAADCTTLTNALRSVGLP